MKSAVIAAAIVFGSIVAFIVIVVGFQGLFYLTNNHPLAAFLTVLGVALLVFAVRVKHTIDRATRSGTTRTDDN